MRQCGGCKHWQGDESTYMAPCALNLAFAARVPFDEPADDCPGHDSGKPEEILASQIKIACGPITNYWGHYWGITP